MHSIVFLGYWAILLLLLYLHILWCSFHIEFVKILKCFNNIIVPVTIEFQMKNNLNILKIQTKSIHIHHITVAFNLLGSGYDISCLFSIYFSKINRILSIYMNSNLFSFIRSLTSVKPFKLLKISPKTAVIRLCLTERHFTWHLRNYCNNKNILPRAFIFKLLEIKSSITVLIAT